MKMFTIYLLLAMSIIQACGNEKPTPETDVTVLSVRDNNLDKVAIQATTQQTTSKISITHLVKGQDVYVECYVPNFVFQKEKKANKNGEGHIEVFVNNKKVETISTAAFVIKGLPKGTYNIKIDLVHNDSTSYQQTKEFQVTIK
ncbi:hypothetical protein [Cytobacillus sp. IB215665]|uniref:hypothetical protein n=1 Tax=Cytobacillus sp. IB215665 TaxID=3097357 RepID=UPI002A101639|nr:hypothetical protein [Cytobacillus sp. IB215665]MDX8364942.1 hypothetical protein [Cytobacillus sp. IB215665]